MPLDFNKKLGPMPRNFDKYVRAIRREAAEGELLGARKRDARPKPLRGGAKALSYMSKFRGGP